MSSTNLFDFYEICFFEMPLVFLFFFFIFPRGSAVHEILGTYVVVTAIMQYVDPTPRVMLSCGHSCLRVFFFFFLRLGASWGSWLGLVLHHSFTIIIALSPPSS